MDCCRFTEQMTRIIPSFAGFTEFTTSIPKMYWDVKSQEQRILGLCKMLDKVICYADMLGENVDEIAKTLKDIEDGKLDPLIEAAIAAWFEDNQPQIMLDIADLQAQLGSGFDAVNNVADVMGTGFDAVNNVASVIGSGFDASNSISDAISAINGKIGDGFSADNPISENVELKGSGTLCATNYLGSLLHPLNDATLGRMHCGSIADCGSYQVIISCPFTADTQNRGIVEFISIENNEKEVFANKTTILGHANSITYDPNRNAFIVAPLYDTSNGTQVLWPVLFVYDITFTTYTSINTDVTISGVSYDHEANKVYCFGIDDKLYELTNDDELVFVNNCNVRSEAHGLHVQDLAVNSGIWYISNTQGNVATGMVGIDNPKNIFDIAKLGTFQLFNLFGEVCGMDFNSNGNLICTSDAGISSAGDIFNIFEIITPETNAQMFYLYHPSILYSSISVTRSSNVLRQTLSLLSDFNAANFISTMIGDVVRFNLTEDYDAPDETINVNGFAKAIINLDGHDLTIKQIRCDTCELVIYGSGTLTIQKFYAPTCDMIKLSLQNNVTIKKLDATEPLSGTSRTGSTVNCGSISNPDNITFTNNVLATGRVYISGSAIVTNA